MDLEIVCFDLDSTLASTYHRQHIITDIRAGTKTWEDYAMACADDTPIEGTVRLARMFHRAGYAIVIVTGRNDVARELTMAWLDNHEIPFHALIMRPKGDQTKNEKYKVDTVQGIISDGYKVALCIEDYPLAAEAIRNETGTPVLLVNANYPVNSPHQNAVGAV